MKVAIWNTPAAAFTLAGVEAGLAEVPLEAVALPPAACVTALLRGDVDVALIPTFVALLQPDEFGVMPHVAVSSWDYPYARLLLKNDLSHPVQRVLFDATDPQAALVARIILKEHYGSTPEFAAVEDLTVATWEADEAADAAVLAGPAVVSLQTSYLTMDLGQEWYELTNYPMVWGLWAMRKDTDPTPHLRAFRKIIKAAEANRALWLEAHNLTPEGHTFFREDLRLRFDDLATASLTELRTYLFYYKLTEEIVDPPFVHLDDAEDDEDETIQL